jgi:hypothetical protein
MVGEVVGQPDPVAMAAMAAIPGVQVVSKSRVVAEVATVVVQLVLMR